GNGVHELSGGLDDHRHSCQLRLRQLEVGQRLPEQHAVTRVVTRRLIRGLHDADRAGGGLQAAVLEPGHAQVEPATDAGLAADEVGGRYPPAVEADLVGVHAAVADRVDS